MRARWLTNSVAQARRKRYYQLLPGASPQPSWHHRSSQGYWNQRSIDHLVVRLRVDRSFARPEGRPSSNLPGLDDGHDCMLLHHDWCSWRLCYYEEASYWSGHRSNHLPLQRVLRTGFDSAANACHS